MEGSVQNTVGSVASPQMHTPPPYSAPLTCVSLMTRLLISLSLLIVCPACPSPSLLSQPAPCQWLQHGRLSLKNPPTGAAQPAPRPGQGHPSDARIREVVDQSPHCPRPSGGRPLPRVLLEVSPFYRSHLLFCFLVWLLSVSYFTSLVPSRSFLSLTNIPLGLRS